MAVEKALEGSAEEWSALPRRQTALYLMERGLDGLCFRRPDGLVKARPSMMLAISWILSTSQEVCRLSESVFFSCKTHLTNSKFQMTPSLCNFIMELTPKEWLNTSESLRENLLLAARMVLKSNLLASLWKLNLLSTEKMIDFIRGALSQGCLLSCVDLWSFKFYNLVLFAEFDLTKSPSVKERETEGKLLFWLGSVAELAELRASSSRHPFVSKLAHQIRMQTQKNACPPARLMCVGDTESED